MIFILWLSIVVLLLIAIGLFLRPLLRRHKEHDFSRRQQDIEIARQQLADIQKQFQDKGLGQLEYEQLKHELEDSLANDISGEHGAASSEKQDGPVIAPMLALTLGIPILAGTIYLFLGMPTALLMEDSGAEVSSSEQTGAPDVGKMIASLEDKLKKNPDDIEGWQFLARSYLVTKQYTKALAVYEILYPNFKEDADFLVKYADLMAISNNRSFGGKTAELLKMALARQPDHPQGLWLSALAMEEANEIPLAIQYWTKLQKIYAADKKLLSQIESNLERLTNRTN